MASLPLLTVLDESQVSPPPATTSPKSLSLTFFDLLWLRVPPHPLHILFFYELPVTKTHFTETIVPNLKQSLSTTLQHFFPFAGKLTIFPASTRKPEIRYVDGDSVDVTIAECNLDFNDLIGNHPRNCDKFYHLTPLLGPTTKVSDYVTIPVFAVQVTLFPNYGISIGMTSHHCLSDAITGFCFKKAWASIAQSGSGESFLAKGTLPVYDRLVKYPNLDESYVQNVNFETFKEKYQLLRLSGPTDKVRATFILTQTAINGLKKLVATELPTLTYVSSLIVTCAYIWSCLAKLNNNELALFLLAVDCRSRLDPPIPSAYFGNCVMPCTILARTTILKEEGGFLRATKLIKENLHKMLSDKDGLVREIGPIGGPTTKITGVAGTPKIRFYDLDFGFGKPIKHEMVSIDFDGSVSISSCRESNEDLEIGVCLTASEMDVFKDNFNSGLESYI